MLNPAKSALGRRVLCQLHKRPWLYRAVNGVAELRGLLPPWREPDLPGRIHRNDRMALDRSAYVKSSRQHFEQLAGTFAKGGKTWEEIGSLIDFGCGYGRVTRWFPTVLNTDQITACDVNPRAVKWCASEYGVRGLIANPDISGTAFGRYDALFACSVLTHFDAERIQVFLCHLRDMLNPGGLAVFTGKSLNSVPSVKKINRYLDAQNIHQALDQTGFYFHPYPHGNDPRLGDTYFTPDWLRQNLPDGLKLLDCHPQAFWSHDGYLVCNL